MREREGEGGEKETGHLQYFNSKYSFSFFFSFTWNLDKVTSLITYEYFKTNYSRSNDNIKEPTSSNALSISSAMAIPKKQRSQK